MRVLPHSLQQLTISRLREFLREPEAVFWTFVFPLLLAAGLGLAFRNRPPERQRVGIDGEAATATQLKSAIQSDSALLPEVHHSSDNAAKLRNGQLAVVVHAHDGRSVTYEFDPTREESRMTRALVDAAIQRGAGRTDPVASSERHVSEPGSRYIDFFIPGLLGMNLMGSGIWGIGFTIVTARNKKLLKRLVATPMSRLQYLLSFLLSRLVFLVLEVVALLGFGYFVFHVPVRGPLIVLATICLLGALCFSGLGLLVAARPTTTEGVSGLMNLVMLPMWVLSGVFFSSQNFPDVAQPFIRVLPLTAVNDALRANMLQGAGYASVWSQIAIVSAWLVVTVAIALRIFRWR